MKPIYLDYNATTPVDPKVLEKMLPYFQTHFGNASSSSHQWGWAADKALKKAHSQVGRLLNAQDNEICFTSGATESNNMAIFGLIRQIRRQDPQAKIHILSSQVEHESVKQALLYARDFESIEVDFLPVGADGIISVDTIEKALKPHTRLMSVIWVQNEIGTIQPIEQIAKLARAKKIYFHTDATQAVGKLAIDLQKVEVDMLSGSAHKFYGPKGTGFLFLRGQNPKVQIQPLLFGGGQERNLRSGTANIPGIVGLGEAAEIGRQNLPSEKIRTEKLRDLLWQELQNALPGIELNGSPTLRSPVNLNVTFTGYNIDFLTPYLPQLALSAGSACHSGIWQISSTLKALGRSDTEAQASLRFSLGRWTTEIEILEAVQIIKKALTNQ